MIIGVQLLSRLRFCKILRKAESRIDLNLNLKHLLRFTIPKENWV